MGIDRKDVRIVCHFNIPKSMEAFYQESGRAGRDQLPSRSLLYYGVDDCRKMEFILSNSKNKKLQSSSSESSSKKPLADFRQMIEYCEGSGCRRKRILENFGEEVAASLCSRSCDACRHPNLVSKYLEELRSTNIQGRNWSSRICIRSDSAFNKAEEFSEFWNREDEASGSEEDVSVSDDLVEVEKCITHASGSSEMRVLDRIELLQRAEENYYRSKHNQEKQATKVDKNAISGTLRESGKQRLLNAMKQNLHRFSDSPVDFVASAEALEDECYKKYEKSGKSFYLSQMASTVRWLSTASPDDLRNRVGTTACIAPEMVRLEPNCSSPSPAPVDPIAAQVHCERVGHSIEPDSPAFQATSPPPILSFSEFINSRKEKDGKSSTCKRQSRDGVSSGLEKKANFSS